MFPQPESPLLRDGITRAHKVAVGNLDRTKHDVDVMEHVFRGVNAAYVTDEPRDGSHSTAVGWRRWLRGAARSESVATADDEGSER